MTLGGSTKSEEVIAPSMHTQNLSKKEHLSREDNGQCSV